MNKRQNDIINKYYERTDGVGAYVMTSAIVVLSCMLMYLGMYSL